MKDRFILMLCLLANIGWIVAQQPPRMMGKIVGRVVDASNQQAIPYATVSILSAADTTKLITGGMTDDEGKFSVEQIPVGEYVAQVNFLGYAMQSFKGVKLTPEQLSYTMGTVSLRSGAADIAEVEVTAEKNAMQIGLDRKIFNVEKTALAKGGTATDVLRNTPSLNVDMDGNISLRGSQGVTVLINGRPSSLTGANRKAILDQIPANMVERVEIITNPSAKFDPDGVSGMINIVLKKNKLEGFSGNVSGGVGTIFNKWDFNTGISYRTNKINLYGNYGLNAAQRGYSGHTDRTTFASDTSFALHSSEDGDRINAYHFAKVGLDYYMTEHSTLAINASINPSAGKTNGATQYQYFDENVVLSSGSARTAREKYNRFSFDAGVNFNQKFKKHAGRELVFDGTISQNSNHDNNHYAQYYWDNVGDTTSLPLLQNNLQDFSNRVITSQLDYTHPIKKSGKLETGIKSTIRNIDNALNGMNYDHASNSYITNSTISNTFAYREQVYAWYSTYGQKVKKWSFQGGLRLEQALTTSKLMTTNQEFVNNYFSYFPSAHIGYELNNQQQVQVSYSRRINRPSIWNLNPFANYSDPYNIRRGNPFLRPEYINSLDLSYIKYFKSITITTSLYYRYTTNIMRRLSVVDTATGVSTLSFYNFSKSEESGIELIVSGNLTKWWRFNGSANVYKVAENGSNLDASYRNNTVWANFSFYSNFSVPKGKLKGLQAELVANYTPPMKLVQGKIYMGAWSSIAVSKTFLKDKLTVSLRLEDPFYLQKFSFNNKVSTFKSIGERRWESRIGWLNVNYTFGKMDMQTRRKIQRRGGGGGGSDMGM